MKGYARLFSIVVLVAVGAATAAAQYSYGSAEGYATITLSGYATTGDGYLGGFGPYYSVYQASYGNTFASDGIGGGGESDQVQGFGVAIDQPSGSYEYVNFEGGSTVTIPNFTAVPQVEYVDVVTYGFASTTTNTWDEQGDSYGEAIVTDSSGAIRQVSDAMTFDEGLYGPGNGWSIYDYDTINGLSRQRGFEGHSFPWSNTVSAQDYEQYTVVIPAGVYETISLDVYEGHENYATTPGPAAIMPFGLGLLGLLRRRAVGR
jgi:hypothetical protein